MTGINGGTESANSAQASATPAASGLPTPWVTQDLGAVGVAGSATYASGAFTLKGSGTTINGTTPDQFRYVFQPLSGDGTIVARVVSVQNTQTYAKAGVMIRETLATNSAFGASFVTPGAGADFCTRTATAGSAVGVFTTGIAAPYWVKEVRSGTTFTSSISPDGVTWTSTGSATISMATNVYVGLIGFSNVNTTLCTAIYDNVSVTASGGSTLVAPSTLAATPGNAQVALSWTASTGATSYNVKRSTTSGGPYVTVATATATTYTDMSVTNGMTYYYVVSAFDGTTESANSTLASAMPVTPEQSWRVSYFGTPANTGNAADAADPDGDGISNLMEYALGSNPLTAGTSGLPFSDIESSNGLNYMTITVPKNSAATDITYIVEVSGDMQTWNSGTTYTTTLQSTATVLRVRDNVAVSTAGQRFIRLRVTSP